MGGGRGRWRGLEGRGKGGETEERVCENEKVVHAVRKPEKLHDLPSAGLIPREASDRI